MNPEEVQRTSNGSKGTPETTPEESRGMSNGSPNYLLVLFNAYLGQI
jgi:hypothetical protein